MPKENGRGYSYTIGDGGPPSLPFCATRFCPR